MRVISCFTRCNAMDPGLEKANQSPDGEWVAVMMNRNGRHHSNINPRRRNLYVQKKSLLPATGSCRSLLWLYGFCRSPWFTWCSYQEAFFVVARQILSLNKLFRSECRGGMLLIQEIVIPFLTPLQEILIQFELKWKWAIVHFCCLSEKKVKKWSFKCLLFLKHLQDNVFSGKQ